MSNAVNLFWVARAKNGELALFEDLPIRYNDEWIPSDENMNCSLLLDDRLFPDLTWEHEPIEVCLQLK